MSAVPTVADTGAPACITLTDAVIAADAKGRAHGLLLGGRRMAEHGLAAVESGLFYLKLAAQQGDHPADIARSAAELEKHAARLLAEIVKLRVGDAAVLQAEAA